MKNPILMIALTLLWLGGCASGAAPGGEDGALARAVEPSLRAAAAAAEAGSDWKGAAQHWRTLHQRNPGDRPIALALARALRHLGQGQAAADLMQDQLARHGRDPHLLGELGKDYLAADRLGLALKALEEACARQPDDWDLQSSLGVALDQQGQGSAARAAYERALALAPGNPQVLNNLALSQALGGSLNQAIDTLRQANEHPQAGAQIRQNLALLLALKGDVAGAERLAAKDLPPDLLRANTAAYRRLAGRQ